MGVSKKHGKVMRMMADDPFTPDCVSPSHLFHCNHLVCLVELQVLRRRRRKMARIQQQMGLLLRSSAVPCHGLH